jgi:hypothetical protein
MERLGSAIGGPTPSSERGERLAERLAERVVKRLGGRREDEGDVGPRPGGDRLDRVGRRLVHQVVGASSFASASFLLDVDRDDRAADDAGVLDGEVARTSDA